MATANMAAFMPSSQAAQFVAVRVPRSLYLRATKTARDGNVSLHALVQDGLETGVRVAEARERYDAYTQIGDDLEACEVDYATHAQAEVMLRDEARPPAGSPR